MCLFKNWIVLLSRRRRGGRQLAALEQSPLMSRFSERHTEERERLRSSCKEEKKRL